MAAAASKAGKGDQDIAKMSFEEALEELKQIVERLEGGEGRLEEAISAYDRGARLKRHCEEKLREAKERIEKISLAPDGRARSEALEDS